MARWFISKLFLYGLCVLWTSTAVAGTRWAILIGVNDYPKSVTPAVSQTPTAGQEVLDWPNLQFAVKDIRALRDALLTVGYAADNIVVIDSLAEDPNLRPTKQNILVQLKQFASNQKLAKEDSLMVVFTGHGFTEKGESLLCPSNIDINKLGETGISVSLISNLLAKAEVAQRYLIIDACRNELSNFGLTQFNMLTGLHKLALQKRDGAQQESAPQGIFYFASSLAGQRSVEDETLDTGHGVFLHFFTQGLKGLADVQSGGDRNRLVSPEEAFKYAADETRRWTRRMFSWEQQPWMEGRSTSGLHLAEVPEEEHQKLLSRAVAIEPPSAFSLQAQHDVELAILAMHAGDNAEATARVEQAIQFDPLNTLARQTRAMLYLLESTQTQQYDEDSEENYNVQVPMPNYEAAMSQMKAVNRPLMLRLANDVQLKNGAKDVATARQGDVILGYAITDFKGQKWLSVNGIKRKGKTSSQTETVLATVSLAALAQSVNGSDQLDEFDSRNQQPGYLIRGNDSGQGGGGGGGERAVTALRITNTILGFTGRGGVSIPGGFGGGGGLGGGIPSIPSFPGRGRIPF